MQTLDELLSGLVQNPNSIAVLEQLLASQNEQQLNSELARTSSGQIGGSPTNRPADPVPQVQGMASGDVAILDRLLTAMNQPQLDSELARTSSGPITQVPMQAAPAPTNQPQSMPLDPVQVITQAIIAKATPENGFTLPEFADSAYPPIATEANAPTMQAGWEKQSPGIFKRRGEKGIEYTNVVDASGTPTMGKGTPTPESALRDPSKPTVTSTQESVMLGSNLQASLDLINKTSDIRTKRMMFSTLQDQVAAEQAKIIEDLRKQAEVKLGVPALENLLKVNEAEDRKHPAWAKQQSDSKQTNDVREELMKARTLADREAQTYVQSNVKLRLMDQQMKSAAGLIDYDMKQAEQRAAQEDRQQAGQDQVKLSKEITLQNKLAETAAKEEEKMALIMSQTTPEQRSRLQVLAPSMAGKSDEELATTLAKGKHAVSADDMKILLAQPESLFPVAMAGSPSAAKVLAFEEANRTGRPEREVLKEVLTMQSQVANPAAVTDMAKKVYPAASENAKRFQALNVAMSTGTATKEQKAEYQQAAVATVKEYNQQVVQSKWLGNLDTWQVRSPEVASAIAKVKEANGKLDIVSVARTLSELTDTKDIVRASEALRQEILSNAQSSKSLLGQPDPDSAWRQVEKEIVKSRFGRLMEKISAAPIVSPIPGVVEGIQGANTSYDWFFGARK